MFIRILHVATSAFYPSLGLKIVRKRNVAIHGFTQITADLILHDVVPTVNLQFSFNWPTSQHVSTLIRFRVRLRVRW